MSAANACGPAPLTDTGCEKPATNESRPRCRTTCRSKVPAPPRTTQLRMTPARGTVSSSPPSRAWESVQAGVFMFGTSLHPRGEPALVSELPSAVVLSAGGGATTSGWSCPPPATSATVAITAAHIPARPRRSHRRWRRGAVAELAAGKQLGECGHVVFRAPWASETEVGQIDAAVRLHQDVSGRHAAMRQAGTVCGSQRAAERLERPGRGRQRLAEEVRQMSRRG